MQHNLTTAQFQFLVSNPQVFERIKSLTEDLGLVSEQVKWLTDNPAAAQGLDAFKTEYSGENNVALVVQMIIDHARNNNISAFDFDEFDNFGETAFPCGICFSIVVNAEYAILKHQNGCTSGWCEWKLYAQATWNVIGSGVHLLLDGAGLFPGIGEIADLTSGVIYFIEGDHVNGTLSLAAMVPFAGWSATGVKFARKSVTGASGRKITLGYVMDTAGKIDFGNSGQLRTVIKPLASEQAHHLIPWASRQHEVVQAAARSTSANAFHMNEALNGLAVSTARHNGSHAAYNDLVEFRLEQIRNKIKDGNGNIDPDVALQEIIGLINKIKTAINSTNAPINQVTF
ncbi:MAG: AHH domain-containing protein [Saprospirales bacterium]|nr:AHH domain-containing protein [Saprospirales bacterium]